MLTKKCIRCNTVKDLKDFPKNPRMPDGLMVCCKWCKNIQRTNSPFRKEQVLYCPKCETKMVLSKKTCIGCKQEKQTTEFVKDKRSKDGFFGYCKSCHSQRIKEYRAKLRQDKLVDSSEPHGLS